MMLDNPLEPKDENDKEGKALWAKFLRARRTSPEATIRFFAKLPPEKFRACVKYWVSHMQSACRPTDDGSYDYTFWRAIFPLMVKKL